MNRTYWALALRCNGIVLDSLCYALDHCLFERSAAYRFWKLVRTMDALLQSRGRPLPMPGVIQSLQEVTESNYQAVYAGCNVVEWYLPDFRNWVAHVMIHYDASHEWFELKYWRWTSPRVPLYLCFGDARRVLELLPTALHKVWQLKS